MTSKIKGIKVKLIKKEKIGVDDFDAPIFSYNEQYVDNVLVTPQVSDDLINELHLQGKKIAYVLAIPKTDSNSWVDCEVEFFNRRFRTVGIETQGIAELIPLDWNKKVGVEYIE